MAGLVTFSYIIFILLYLLVVLLTACSFLLNNFVSDLLTLFVSFEIRYLQTLEILGHPSHHILQIMRKGNVQLG